MPNIVKIGKTKRDVELRLAELYSTGVTFTFKCGYAAKVKDIDMKERAFHSPFLPSGINLKR